MFCTYFDNKKLVLKGKSRVQNSMLILGCFAKYCLEGLKWEFCQIRVEPTIVKPARFSCDYNSDAESFRVKRYLQEVCVEPTRQNLPV